MLYQTKQISKERILLEINMAIIIMIKESICHEKIVQNVYASNNRDSKYMIELKEKTDFFVASNYNYSWIFEHLSLNK